MTPFFSMTLSAVVLWHCQQLCHDTVRSCVMTLSAAVSWFMNMTQHWRPG